MAKLEPTENYVFFQKYKKKRLQTWRNQQNTIIVRNLLTYIDQPEVVLIYGKLFRSNLLLQSRGIGAL